MNDMKPARESVSLQTGPVDTVPEMDPADVPRRRWECAAMIAATVMLPVALTTFVISLVIH